MTKSTLDGKHVVVLNRREVDFLGSLRAYNSLTVKERAGLMDQVVANLYENLPNMLVRVFDARQEAPQKRPVRKKKR